MYSCVRTALTLDRDHVAVAVEQAEGRDGVEFRRNLLARQGLLNGVGPVVADSRQDTLVGGQGGLERGSELG